MRKQFEKVVPGRHGLAVELTPGQYLRVVDLEGRQVIISNFGLRWRYWSACRFALSKRGSVMVASRRRCGWRCTPPNVPAWFDAAFAPYRLRLASPPISI